MARFALVIVAIMATMSALVYYKGGQVWTVPPSFGIEIVLFLGLSTLVIFYFLTRHATSSAFVQAYLTSIVLKMLAYASFVLVIILYDPSGAYVNAVWFLIAYVMFTALEVGFLFRRLNR